MRITVNGDEREIEPGTTLGSFLACNNLQPMRVAVEVNRDLVPRRQFDTTTLQENDQIEIVTLVGGG